MRVVIVVTDLDGVDREVTAEFSALVGYEKYTGRSVGTWATTPPGVYDFAVLAWIAETDQAVPLRAWTDSVEMAVMRRTESVDPTRPGPLPGPPSP
jgi:hypothetical protein